MTQTSLSPRPLFTRRALWLIFGGGLLSLVCALVLMWVTDPRDEVESIDTDTFSISAIGHMAFLEMLEAHDIDTMRGRYKSDERMGRGDLLVVAEPHLMLGDRDGGPLLKKYRTMLSRSSNTLLVLPKRDGLRDSFSREWLGAAFMVPEADVRYVLKASGVPGAQISRTRRPASDMTWSSPHDPYVLSFPPEMYDVQLLLPGPEIEPVITTPYGILLGRVKSKLSSEPIWVLSDPDLIATHGLHRGSNTPLAIAMVQQAMGSSRGDVIFDEVIHGHERIPSFEERLLQFPLLPATIQVCLLLFFLLWTFVLRFGPPLRVSQERAPGKAFVVNNTAELLTAGKHSAHTTERYIWMVLQDTARGLHAPSRQSQAELLGWLQTRADAHGIDINLRGLTDRAHGYADGVERARSVKLLELALSVDRFRREMLA